MKNYKIIIFIVLLTDPLNLLVISCPLALGNIYTTKGFSNLMGIFNWGIPNIYQKFKEAIFVPFQKKHSVLK